jgi:hypothetical protein
MVPSLPTPEVVRRYCDDAFEPPLPTLSLNWRDGAAERLWQLPEDVSLLGPPPRRFGVSVRRLAADAYAVRLLWDRTSLAWKALSRLQLLGSALAPLLNAVGADLRQLLDQPIERAPRQARPALAA